MILQFCFTFWVQIHRGFGFVQKQHFLEKEEQHTCAVSSLNELVYYGQV